MRSFTILAAAAIAALTPTAASAVTPLGEQATSIAAMQRLAADQLAAAPAAASAMAYDRSALHAALPLARQTSPLPDPQTWTMMFLGLTLVGFAMRWRRSRPADAPRLA